MAGPSPLRTLHYLHAFSKKSPSSTLSPMKLRTLVHTLILSHVCRVARALAKAKSILTELLKEIELIDLFTTHLKIKIKIKSNKKRFGSFRLHYNWCSSHVLPVSTPVPDGIPTNHVYYDSTWNSIVSTECDDTGELGLSGYLHGLEEKEHDSSTGDIHDIDRLADMFIASSHEKFRLEKQESCRRFQEMMARSL